MKINILFLIFLSAVAYLLLGASANILTEMGFRLNYVTAFQISSAILVIVFYLFLCILHFDYVQAGNIVIRRVSVVKETLERAIINVEGGQDIEDHIFWDLIGVYESRIFGLCIHRCKSDKLVEELTDRYIAAKVEHKMPLLKSLEQQIKEPKKMNDCG